MSADLPAELDVWRAVAGRREFCGRIGLVRLERLLPALGLDDPGRATAALVRYRVGFDRDPVAGPCVELEIEASLPLVCQRSLEPFELPVRVIQRLGLIRREEQEASLPDGYEPRLVDETGLLAVQDLIEDELILALPVVPIKPGSEPVVFGAGPGAQEPPGPFAALETLRSGRRR